LYVALDQQYIHRQAFDEVYEQAEKTAKMVSGLITYLRNNIASRTKETRGTK
jgi:hypothetical protein